MRLHPILAALTRHKIPVSLLVLQVALTLAVLSNSSFMLADYLRRISIDSGIAEERLGILKLMPYTEQQTVDVNARVSQYLRGLSGVSDVGLINTVPFGPREADLGVRLAWEDQKNQVGAHVFTLGPDTFQSLGLELIAGRLPMPSDFVESASTLPASGTVYVTQALAERLWPDDGALGKTIYVNASRFTIVGVIRHLLRPEFELQPLDQSDWSLAVPMSPGAGLYGNYVFRAPASQLESTLASIRRSFAKEVPGLAVDEQNTQSVAALRSMYLQGDKSVMGMLASIVLLTLITTMLGIVGLTSYWVRRRRRQIGVRRALGATRWAIASYFIVENGMIMIAGCTLGIALAYAVNLELMRYYSLGRLPLVYLPVTFIFMIVAGQLAALGPALKGSRVQPVDAIREA